MGGAHGHELFQLFPRLLWRAVHSSRSRQNRVAVHRAEPAVHLSMGDFRALVHRAALEAISTGILPRISRGLPWCQTTVMLSASKASRFSSAVNRCMASRTRWQYSASDAVLSATCSSSRCWSSKRTISCSRLVRRAVTSALRALRSCTSMASARYACSHLRSSLSHRASCPSYSCRSCARALCCVLVPCCYRSSSWAMRAGLCSTRSTAAHTTGSIAVACTLRRVCGATTS
jgi:hypothetical protein